MNFKRNCLMIIALTSCAINVTSCKSHKAFVRYEFINEINDPNLDAKALVENFKAPLKDTETETDRYMDLGSNYNVLTKYAGSEIIKPTGEHKLLVIPVDFEDYKTNKLKVSDEEYITNINKAFFGNAKINRYVSVSEFYNRSSYGKLKISGKVCDQIYTFPVTVTEANKGDVKQRDVSKYYEDIKTWYKNTYGPHSLDEFRIDQNNMNSDPAIYLVYTYPTEDNEQNPDFFWNFTFPNIPLSWTSYSSMNTISGDPDAHTFIHETGHLLGLPDYYPKTENDLNKKPPEPTGRIDIMDCSVGDHSSFSKMFLNWARPYYVNETTNINIKPLNEMSDFILINDNWNGSVFDEYYLIEFYTPAGLNYYDSNVGNNLATLPLVPGVKIYHVDARLGYYKEENRSKVFKDYVTKEAANYYQPGSQFISLNLAHDNSTYSDASEEDFQKNNYLYELMLNHVGHAMPACAKDYNLFHLNDSFVIDSSSWHTQNSSSYVVKITDVSFRSASIEITKQ